MSILIIGGRGFIGDYLRQELIDKNIDVFVSSSSKNQGFIKLDITKKEDFDNLPKDIEVIFHLGAFIPVENNIENVGKCLEINSIGTLNVLEFCRRRDIKLINSSSASVYGFSNKFPINENSLLKPYNFYGISKLVGELYCEVFRNKYGLKYISLRYSSVYGKGQKENTVLPFFIKKVKDGKNITLFGDGRRFQDFVYVKDIINANIMALQSNNNGIYNIGSGRATTMFDLANLIIKKFSNKNINILFDKNREDTSPNMLLNISKAEDELKYKVNYNLEEGLEDYKKNEQNS